MLKRDLKLFWRCIRSSCALLILLVGLCTLTAVVLVRTVSETYTLPKVAIVDNEDSLKSRILVNAISNMEYVSELMEPVQMDEDEAREAMRNGECAAAVILPDGFVEDVLYGRTSKGTILISPELKGQGAIVASLAKAGEQLLSAGQYGIFAGGDLLYEYDVGSDDYDYFYDTANPALLSEAAEAMTKYFTFETVDYSLTGMPSESYFALCWTVALLFLISLFFLPLYKADCSRALLSRLYVCGVNSVAFVRWKLMLSWLVRLLLLIAAWAVMTRIGLMLQSVSTLLWIAFAALYTALIGACLTLCFGNGITSNIIFAVVGLFLCGGIVPRQLLAPSIVTVGSFTPFGVAQTILAPAFGGDVDPIALAAAALYALIAAIMIISHLERTRAGREELSI